MTATVGPSSGVGAMVCALVLASVSCAKGPAFDSVATLPDAGRHPPGVSVDPAGELPARAPRGRTAMDVVVLGTPTNPETIRAVVRSYIHAIVTESSSELDALLAPRATITTKSRQLPAREHLAARFARYDYGSLRGSGIYREDELEISEPDPVESRERAMRAGLDPDADQRIVRVPVSQAGTGRQRLFGDDIVLRLVSHESGWTVLEITEDF